MTVSGGKVCYSQLLFVSLCILFPFVIVYFVISTTAVDRAEIFVSKPAHHVLVEKKNAPHFWGKFCATVLIQQCILGAYTLQLEEQCRISP